MSTWIEGREKVCRERGRHDFPHRPKRREKNGICLTCGYVCTCRTCIEERGDLARLSDSEVPEDRRCLTCDADLTAKARAEGVTLDPLAIYCGPECDPGEADDA